MNIESIMDAVRARSDVLSESRLAGFATAKQARAMEIAGMIELMDLLSADGGNVPAVLYGFLQSEYERLDPRKPADETSGG